MPNELYVKWLGEWMDKAYDLQSKGYQTLRKAHDSMKACPFEIGHPSQAAQLKGIGPVLCAKLEKALIAHCKENKLPLPSRPTREREDGDHGQEVVAKKKRVTKSYVPNYGSGPWAILMGLSEPGVRDNLPKSEVIRFSQPYCSTSFEVATDSRGFYMAWSSMNTLITKELVHKAGNPAKYSLTDAGTEVAMKLRSVPNPEKLILNQAVGATNLSRTCSESMTQDIRDDDQSEQEVELPPAADITAQFEPIIIPRHQFEIQLLIDVREVNKRRDRTFIEEQLSMAGMVLITRALDVGDAMWIAKCRDGREIVLDHIVERKRMDDLVSSIKDGRFHEQKFRLQKCGARHVIYIIEEQNMHEVLSYHEAIQTAISSTQVVNGFFVKRVQSLDFTIRYLVSLTKKLERLYKKEDLYVLPDRMVDSRTFTSLTNHLREKHPTRRYYMSYDAFAGLSAKTINLQVGDIWLRMLMTIRGVSAEKAIEIQSKFPTLAHLLQAYDDCPNDAARDKLMTVSCVGYGRKAIGVALSKKIAAQFK